MTLTEGKQLVSSGQFKLIADAHGLPHSSVEEYEAALTELSESYECVLVLTDAQEYEGETYEHAKPRVEGEIAPDWWDKAWPPRKVTKRG